MGHGKQVVYISESDDSDYGSAIQVDGHHRRQKIVIAEDDLRSNRSRSRVRYGRAERSPQPQPKNTINLTIPQQRQRAASTGAASQPNIIFVERNDDRDRDRSRSRQRHRYERDSSSDRSSGRGRRSRHHSRAEVDYETLAKLKLQQEERSWADRQKTVELEIEKRKREEKEAEAAYQLKWEKAQADKKAREEEAAARAEAKRKKEEEEAAEYRKQVIMEEHAKAEKKKKDEEEMRKRFLREEEEKKEKEKAKKKKEEEEFNQKVKERFMKAGYDPDYIEDILEEKKAKRESLHRRISKEEAEMSLDLKRPTYIRVRRIHLHPDTLDYYQLPWEYDKDDTDYILIKKYVPHTLQQELFLHSAKIFKRKETKYITGGIEKETITTLKPSNVYKGDKDEMYVVRRKSVSKGRSPGRNWMFT